MEICALAELAEQAGLLDLGPLRWVGTPAHYLAAINLDRVGEGAEGVVDAHPVPEKVVHGARDLGVVAPVVIVEDTVEDAGSVHRVHRRRRPPVRRRHRKPAEATLLCGELLLRAHEGDGHPRRKVDLYEKGFTIMVCSVCVCVCVHFSRVGLTVTAK